MKKINLKSLILIIAAMAIIMSCFMVSIFADDGDKIDAMIEINANEKLSGAFIKKVTLDEDGYIGIPVELSIYYDYATHGKINPLGWIDAEGPAVVLYVVNTELERIGTKPDTEIISGLLDRGWVVAVADYKNNAKADTPDLDWSCQRIRDRLYKGEFFSDTTDKIGKGTYVTNFILPAGYDVEPYQVFWEIDKHGADGSLEKIVENWNTDFRASQNREDLVYWCDASGSRKATWNAPDGSAPQWLNANGAADANGKYIKLKYTKAEKIEDCVNPDGTPINLNLYAHVIYPTNPEKAVPVMNLASCGLYLSSAKTSEDEYCDFTGFLFNGYAGMIYDYLWYPMARQFGIFDGNKNSGGVTGDHMNYALYLWNDKKVNTAAMRFARHLAVDEADTYKFDTDHMGVIGLSKGSWFDFLGEAELRNYTVSNPEGYTADQLKELIDTRINNYTHKRYFEGHHGESRYQAGKTETEVYSAKVANDVIIDGGELQPWLLYETTGREILSFASYTYTACGSQLEDISAGHAPAFQSHALNDSFSNAYSLVGPALAAMDIPSLDFVCDIHHAMAYGPDEHYGVDTYRAQFAFANYFLKDTPISVIYTDPVGNSTGLKINENIKIAFAGTASYECMFDITLRDSSGNIVSGDWTSERGGVVWTFSHEPLIGGETYTLTVPASFAGTNGKQMGKDYVVEFKTVNENVSSVESHGSYANVTVPSDIKSGVKLGFFVENDAYNTAEIYLVAAEGETSGELLGSVNVSGKGWYELDVTEVAAKNIGNTLTFFIKAKRAAGDAYSYEGMDYSYGARITKENTTFDGKTAVKTIVGNNGGYTVPGYDTKVNVFYSNVTTLVTNNKILGSNKITAADIGRKLTIKVSIYDTVSRTIQLSLNNTNDKTNKTIDLNSQTHNFKTEANKWNEFCIDYIVYEPTYGDVAGSHVKTLTVSASPTGDTHKPLWVAATTVTETVTELSVADAYISVYDDGYAYKADAAEGAFLVDGTYYSTFASALAAANGKTITLTKNYEINSVSDAFAVGGATNVTVDLNGYTVRACGTSPVNIAAKNATELNVTFKNGYVYLYNGAFLGYASTTGAAAGKTVNVNLENVDISNADNSRLYGFMTEKALPTDVKMNVHVNLTDCDIKVDAYSNIKVNFEIFGIGTNNLFVDYKICGGSITADSFARAYISNDTGKVVYTKGADGELTKLILSVGTPAPQKRLGAYTDVYAEFKLSSTDGLAAVYEITQGAGATKYGVIPEEYLDANEYPFVLFDNVGNFKNAFSVILGKENGPFTKAKTLNYQNNVWDEVKETYGARPYASYILMRRDYTIDDSEYDNNFAQNQGTTTLDLAGFTLTKIAGSSAKAKMVFNGTAKAFTGTGDAYTYPSSFVIENGKIVTNVPLLSVTLYGTTYDISKKVMNFTFNNLEIVAAEGTTTNRFLHRIDSAPTGAKGPSTYNIEYNDCIFDLRGYTSPASDTRIFDANATEATMVNMQLKVNGGKILANDFANMTLTKLDTYWGSSITFDKGSDENYTAIELASSATVIPSTETINTPDGGKVYSKKSTADGVDTYLLSGKITEYGAVPDEYTDADQYPFLVFANGDFKGGYAYWADSDSTVNSAIERAVELANGAGGVGVKVTILLQRDYTNSRGNADNNSAKFGTFTGELTVDLADNTLTAGAWMLFSFNGQLVGGKLYDAKITVKNGTMHAGGKVIYAVEMYNNAWTEASHGRKRIDVTFSNVTFAQSPSYTAEKVPFLKNTTSSSPIDFKATYENCTFDYENHASGTAFTMLDFSKSGGVKADITVKGGTVKTTTFNNFNFYKGSTGDSLKFVKDADGEYMIASLPEDGAITTAGFTSSDGKMLNYAHADTVDGRKLYKLVSLVTPYGTIPTANASLVDYPFAVFANGTFLGAYQYFADAYDKDGANSAIEKAKAQMHGAGGAGKLVTVLMRRDFVNLDGIGAGGTSTLGRYNNFSQVGGILDIDLGGYTLTSGTWMLFCLQAKTVDGAIFDTEINVKNGSLHTGNKVLVAVESTSTDFSSLGTKLFKMTFENVTFADSPDYSGEKASIILNNTTNANPVKLDVKFKNCVFDYGTHASGTKVTFLDFKKNGGVSLAAEFVGGEFKLSTFSNFNIATLDSNDTLVFAPNEAGKYMVANVNNGGTITTADYKTKDGKVYNFGLMNDTATVDTYVLMDLNTPYGKIDYRYASAEKYPFIIFDKTGYRYAATVFYGAQVSSSAISRAIYSITAASNAWENGTYGDDANYAIILLRRDYTIASTEKHDNLAHNQGVITIDLGGYTMTSAADKYMFAATIKRWPSSDSGDAAEVFPSTYVVKNGTLVSVNKSLVAFDAMSSTSINLLVKTFTWQFDNVTFKNTGSAANPFLACFYKTGLVNIPTPVIYNDCTFDLSNATSAKSVFNIDPGHDVQLHVKVNGGKIIAPSNISRLDVLRVNNNTNGSTIVFGKGTDGKYIQIITKNEYTNTESLPTASGNMKFMKAEITGDGYVYSLMPSETPNITPKLSITLDRNLIYNVYVPANADIVRIVVGGTEYTDISALVKETVGDTEFYVLKCSVPAKQAAESIALEIYLDLGGETVRGRWSLGIEKYANKLLADTSITEYEKTLIKDILSYVGAAYTYFKMANAAEVNTRIDAIIGADYESTSAPVIEGSAAAETSGLKSATFVLDETPAMRFYLADGADASKYAFFIGGKRINTEISADGKYIDIDVYAYALCETVTYTIGGAEAGSFHIRAYYEWAKAQNDEALTDLVARFWKYLQSAREFRAEMIECQHEYADGFCTECGAADPNFNPAPEPEDFGSMTLNVPTEIYANYSGKDVSVSFSKQGYNGDVAYTTDNANVFVENGKIFAKGNFASAVTVTVTAVTEHHTATATVTVSNYNGNINAETKVQYYEANIIKEENKGGMIFVGDSYFDGYKMESIPFYKDFYKDFAGEKAFLMGLSSSQIHQLEMVSERIVYPMEPSEIVIHIGHNDMHHGSLTPDQFVTRLQALISEYHAKLPNAKIYVFSVDPKRDATPVDHIRHESSFVKAPAVNAAMKAFADANAWAEYVDTTYIFYGEGESINTNMYPKSDASHPTLQAYDLMRVALNQARGKTADIVSIENLDASLGGNVAGKYFTDKSGNAPKGDFAISGRLVITNFVKNNAHLQFRFAQGDSDCRFILWDANSDGKFGAGYIAGGKSANDKTTGINLYDANTKCFILPWAVIVKDDVAYWYLNGKLMQTITSPVREYFNIGAIGLNAILYDVKFNVKAENETAYNEQIAAYVSDNVVNIQNSGALYNSDINSSGKYITDASGNALTDNYIVKGKLDIQEINKNNGHVQFRFGSGYRFLLWDQNSDGKVGAGYTEGGVNTNDSATGITVYDANFGLTLEWVVVVKDGKAHWFINGKHEKTFETPVLQSFNLGALQMDVLFYDIEVCTKAEDADAFNKEAAKYDPNSVYLEMVGKDGIDITANGKTFTDASGNNLTNNYIIRGTLDIGEYGTNGHIQFRVGSGCRFLLWDANSDGVFGAGYMFGSSASDKTAGVTLYDAKNGLTVDWAVVVNEGKAYWYVNGVLEQSIDAPTLQSFNLGALMVNALFYDIELYVKADGADAYNAVLAEYLV